MVALSVWMIRSVHWRTLMSVFFGLWGLVWFSTEGYSFCTRVYKTGMCHYSGTQVMKRAWVSTYSVCSFLFNPLVFNGIWSFCAWHCWKCEDSAVTFPENTLSLQSSMVVDRESRNVVISESDLKPNFLIVLPPCIHYQRAMLSLNPKMLVILCYKSGSFLIFPTTGLKISFVHFCYHSLICF